MWVGAGWGPRQREKGCRGSPEWQGASTPICLLAPVLCQGDPKWTLCLACKKVDEEVYEEWRQRHQEASILLQNLCAQALHQVYEEMEQSLEVGGAGAGPHTPAPLGSPPVRPHPLLPPHPSSSWEPRH